MEKSKQLNDPILIYKSRLYWYKNFEWIAQFMKMRSDPTTPLAAKLMSLKENDEKSESTEPTQFYEIVEHSRDIFDEDSENDEIRDNNEDSNEDHNDVENNLQGDDSSPPNKKKKCFYPPTTFIKLQKSEKDDKQSRTIEYIINEESELIPNTTRASSNSAANNTNAQQYVEYNSTHHKVVDLKKVKRRSRAFGKFVGSLMTEITEDKLFFETQSEILKIIENASTKNSED